MRELCSEHGSTCGRILDHEKRVSVTEERIDHVMDRVDRLEEVQGKMVSQLTEASAGLKALASKIDDAVHAANGGGNPSPTEEVGQKAVTFSQSLNKAWRHFQDNFAMFIIYCAMALFAWAVVKMFIFREIPPMIKSWLL